MEDFLVHNPAQNRMFDTANVITHLLGQSDPGGAPKQSLKWKGRAPS